MANYSCKYRAYVADINDPLHMGRIRVKCPKILGNSLSAWCLPCLPTAYDGGGDFHYPKIGETVFIEFEDNDLRKPIYTGTWYSRGSCPLDDYDPEKRIISWGHNKILFTYDTLTIMNVIGERINTITLNSEGVNVSTNKATSISSTEPISVTGKSVSVSSESGDVEVSGANLNLKGDSVSVQSKDSSMSYKDGNAGIDSKYGKVSIDKDNLTLEHNNGSKLVLNESSIDLEVTDSEGKKHTLSFTPELIDSLKGG